MKKKLLLFGSNGELGKGITEILVSKDFDEIYLFDFSFDKKIPNTKQIVISDLSLQNNVENAFTNFNTDKETALFFFSTVGGFWGGYPVWETNNDDLEKMLNMNFITNFNLAKKFSQLVSQSKYGVCGFTSAYTASHPSENKFAYGVSKAALSYLIKSLAIEGEKINLSSFGVAPFIIDTKPNRNWMPEADFDKWIKPTEIGEIIYSIFENYRVNSGNIIELKIRLAI